MESSDITSIESKHLKLGKQLVELKETGQKILYFKQQSKISDRVLLEYYLSELETIIVSNGEVKGHTNLLEKVVCLQEKILRSAVQTLALELFLKLK